MKSRIIVFMIIFITFSCADLNASEKNDTIRKPADSVSVTPSAEKLPVLNPYHWNVIKFNPTPMLLWGDTRNVTLSYERLIKKNQSIAIQIGYLVLPKFFDTLVGIFRLNGISRQGINLAFDYRYYLSSLNRRPAPYGLYLGGYLSYYGFKFNNHLEVLNTSQQIGTFNGKLNMLNLGIELGYQFIFWKRFSVDLLMFGPSLTYCSRQLEITGDLDKDQIENIDEEFVDKLMNRFPVLGYLFGGETTTFSGSKVNFRGWLRYSLQLGVHF